MTKHAPMLRSSNQQWGGNFRQEKTATPFDFQSVAVSWMVELASIE